MNQARSVPEYILAESEKILPMGNLQASFVQDLRVDIQVLYKELTKLEGFCGRIADDIKALALLESEQE